MNSFQVSDQNGIVTCMIRMSTYQPNILKQDVARILTYIYTNILFIHQHSVVSQQDVTRIWFTSIKSMFIMFLKRDSGFNKVNRIKQSVQDTKSGSVNIKAHIVNNVLKR